MRHKGLEHRLIPQEKRYQLAEHYLKKLIKVCTAYSRGYENISYAFTLYDQEWPQIKHWGQWVSKHAHLDEQVAQLSIEYSLHGEEIFNFRLTHQEQIEWVETGLASAQKLQDQEAEVKCLFRMEWHIHKLSRLDEAHKIAYDALALAETIQDLLSVGRLLNLLAEISIRRGDYDEAWNLCRRSFETLSELNAEAYLPEVYWRTCEILYNKGDFNGAIGYALQWVDLIKAQGFEVGYSYNPIGLISCEAGNYEVADYYLSKSRENNRKRGAQSALAQALLWSGYLEFCKHNYPTAEKYYDESLQIAQAINEAWLIPVIEIEHGELLYTTKRLKQAEQKLNRTIDYARNNGYRGLLSQALIYLAEMQIGTKQLNIAHETLAEGLIIACEDRQIIEIMRGLQVASQFAYQCGQIEQAAEWLGIVLTQQGVIAKVYHRASQLYVELQQQIDPELLNNWLERGKNLDFDLLVENLARNAKSILRALLANYSIGLSIGDS
jgi:tetratricopeptide (TPR) repeat protein